VKGLSGSVVLAKVSWSTPSIWPAI
jgi:hypothetical protein